MAARRSTRRIALHAVGLFLLPLLVFAPVIGFGFVQDDTFEIVRNESLRAPLATTLRAVWHAEAHAQGIPNATRPATIASLTLDYRAFGLAPWGFHAHSLLLHALSATAAAACALALTRRRRVALIAGVLFALAPLHAEAIAAVSNRDELLAALMTLVTLSAIAWPRPAPMPLGAELAVAGAWLIGLGAKETALALPLLVLAAWAILRPPRADRLQRESLIFVLFGVLILWINWRYAVLLGGDGIPRSPKREWLATAAETARFEVLAAFQAFLPFRAITEYARDAPASAVWLVGLLGLFALIVVLSRRRTTRVPALGLAFALAAPLPASPIFGPVTPRADRYLYLAVFGGALGWAWAADRLARRAPRRWVHAGAVAALLILAVACRRSIAPWANERALWTRAVADAPDSPRAWTALSRVHRLAGELDAADTSVQRAIVLDPSYVPARVTRAHNALARGDTAAARRELHTIENLGGTSHPGFARARQCADLDPTGARDCIAK